MKRHKNKDSSDNKVFYLHITNVRTPIQMVEECYSVNGPKSKEDFEDFRYENWEKQINNLADQDALLVLTRHEAEKLHLKLSKMLSE